MNLISKVSGIDSEEEYFSKLGEEDKDKKTYNVAFRWYVRKCQNEKGLALLCKMREMGIACSADDYNATLRLCKKLGQHEKIPEVLAEMKKENMDFYTYDIAADFYIKAGQTENAIDALKRSEEKFDKQTHSYETLISHYARLKCKDEVLRLWGLKKNACGKCTNKDYIFILPFLMELGEFGEAVKILMEWESLLKDLMDEGNATGHKLWQRVAAGYADNGKMEKAIECMKLALKVWKEGGRRPNDKLVTTFLSWLGDEGSVEDAEAFVGSLQKVIPVNVTMYHALLKAYIRGGEDVKKVVDRMKADGIRANKETRRILEPL